ncbi:serine/threonine-protein kinase [Streptomyces sp. NPDC059897]|uniref:serine/threonine-protein kinase n=1 Tax=Streptomyces sp. NPDC059897 TaxID=3346994 RepID=UPI0036660820
MDGVHEVFQPLRADDPKTVGGYRLAARLGAGGMGRVYLSHTRGGRPVALKVVRPELADDPAFRRRFAREIKAAQRVRGAYTAELIDADAEAAPPWLATLYVPGPSLAAAVARHGPLPVPAVLWLMAAVAEALGAIHGVGIVHRDLKPSNVLLAADGPRVIDFGISVAADLTSSTVTGSAVGTPQFMAPEQAVAGQVGPATDVFALGQTAAFAALGAPLYGEGQSVGVLYRIVHERPDLSVLPAELRPILDRCLQARPEDRATPEELVAWCRRSLGGGASPAVWREFAGSSAPVPAPPLATVPDSAADAGTVRAADAVTVRAADGGTVPATVAEPGTPALPHPAHVFAPPPERLLTSQERRARRRRTVLVTAAVTAGVVLATGLAWVVADGAGGTRGREASGAGVTASGSAGKPGGGSSEGTGRPSASAAVESAQGIGADEQKAAGDGTDGSSGDADGTPRAEAYAQRWLDEKYSLSTRDPEERKTGGRGDIRFVCKQVGCALESDTSVFTLLYDKPGADHDTCRLAVTGQKSHRLPLSGAAGGSEICVRNSAGDIALLVVQTKSTALWDKPGISFLTADVTLWRAPKV